MIYTYLGIICPKKKRQSFSSQIHLKLRNMSKAEEEANKRYCITRGDDTEETSGIDMQRAMDFIDGYHQAEKDMELTWEDISTIREILCGIVGYPLMTDKEVCTEVLKRFKERKIL